MLSCLQFCLSPQHSASLSLPLSTTDLLATEVPTHLRRDVAGKLAKQRCFSAVLLCYQKFGKGWRGWAISY